MEFNLSLDQTNFMGYCPPSQYDSSHYSNDGWKYHQEITNSEHSNPWRYVPEPQIDQANHMRYCPEPQNDICHYPRGICAYQQECEQSSERNFLPEPQSESYCYDTNTNYGWEGNSNAPYDIQQEPSSLDYAFNKFMQDCPPMPQSDPHPSHCGWEDQNQKAIDSSYSIYQEPLSLEHTFNSFMQNCSPSPPSFSFENSSSLDFALTQSFLQDPYNSAHQP
ncbi:hypothetical protein AHAS_Ahas15G0184900 [Arachis hypogaea]